MIRLSGSLGETHSSFETFLFFRFLSKRRISSSLGSWSVSIAALFAHQPRDELLPVLARVAPHDALHGRVGFQRGRSTPTVLPEEPLLGGDAQHELKHLVEHFFRQAATGIRERLGVGRGLVQRNAQELPQAQAVGAPPGDAPLAVDALEVTDQQHAKVHARRNRWLAALLFLLVVLLATPFDPVIEVGFGQQGVELLIKRMTRRLRQAVGHDEQRLLPLLSLTHRHRAILRAKSVGYHARHDTMPVKPFPRVLLSTTDE